MHTKKRVRQHMMEDRSIQIVRELLPEQWVVREYKPDYGIDLLVELFEYVDAERMIAATLGETLFVQVKSTEVVQKQQLRVHPRRNVELGPLAEDRGRSSLVEVTKLRIETSELRTVHAIGAAIPALLFLVELSTRRIYYVCLNDLIEKLVIPQDPSYHLKQSKVVHIPARNCISAADPHSVQPLGTYAKRPKLYAAFEKFGYQKHELEYAIPLFQASQTEARQEETARGALDLVRHFLAIILRYDFWTRMPEWRPVVRSHQELRVLELLLQNPRVESDINAIRAYLLNEPAMRRDPQWVNGLSLPAAREELLAHIGQIWHRLWNLGGMYEEVVREWLLPTYLADIL